MTDNQPLPDGVEEIIPGANMPAIPMSFRYRNWRNEVADRSALPIRMFVGRSKWHPIPQWMLLAHDLERDALRCFAMTDILQIYHPKLGDDATVE